jgi:glucose-6-phosphate 1-epimerase
MVNKKKAEALHTPSTAHIFSGESGMPKVQVSATDGAQVEVYLHAAHVTSWIPAGGAERLFLSRKSEFHPGAAIRGGVPIIFPQFSNLGTLPRHGFARTTTWELDALGGDQGYTSAEFHLADDEATRRLWPHSFLAKMKVSVGGKQMLLSFTVVNTGDGPFSFTAALHTYLRVENIMDTFIDGLSGLRFHDTVNRATPADWVVMVQDSPTINFPGEVDRIYHDVQGPLRVLEPDRITTISMTGFSDAVVWNPGPGRAARLADMEPEGYRRMVCVEAAVIGLPVTLDPGKAWQGTQLIFT